MTFPRCQAGTTTVPIFAPGRRTRSAKSKVPTVALQSKRDEQDNRYVSKGAGAPLYRSTALSRTWRRANAKHFVSDRRSCNDQELRSCWLHAGATATR